MIKEREILLKKQLRGEATKDDLQRLKVLNKAFYKFGDLIIVIKGIALITVIMVALNFLQKYT